MNIYPSILNADNLNLDREIKAAAAVGVTTFHIDIMDGHFVPNLSFGPQLVDDFKREFPMLNCELHFMSDNPKDLLPDFVAAGADAVALHYEALPLEWLYYWFDYLHANGVKAILAISPDTPLAKVKPIINKPDQILVMTVKPGFGKQKFMEQILPKIRQIKSLSSLPVEVDGGINDVTIKKAQAAGANIFVAGSFLFKNGAVRDQLYRLQKAIS